MNYYDAVFFCSDKVTFNNLYVVDIATFCGYNFVFSLQLNLFSSTIRGNPRNLFHGIKNKYEWKKTVIRPFYLTILALFQV